MSSSPKLSKDKKEKLIALIKEGKLLPAEIANEVGCKTGNVHFYKRMLKDSGEKFPVMRGRKRTPLNGLGSATFEAITNIVPTDSKGKGDRSENGKTPPPISVPTTQIRILHETNKRPASISIDGKQIRIPKNIGHTLIVDSPNHKLIITF